MKITASKISTVFIFLFRGFVSFILMIANGLQVVIILISKT